MVAGRRFSVNSIRFGRGEVGRETRREEDGSPEEDVRAESPFTAVGGKSRLAVGEEGANGVGRGKKEKNWQECLSSEGKTGQSGTAGGRFFCKHGNLQATRTPQLAPP